MAEKHGPVKFVSFTDHRTSLIPTKGRLRPSERRPARLLPPAADRAPPDVNQTGSFHRPDQILARHRYPAPVQSVHWSEAARGDFKGRGRATTTGSVRQGAAVCGKFSRKALAWIKDARAGKFWCSATGSARTPWGWRRGVIFGRRERL